MPRDEYQLKKSLKMRVLTPDWRDGEPTDVGAIAFDSEANRLVFYPQVDGGWLDAVDLQLIIDALMATAAAGLRPVPPEDPE